MADETSYTSNRRLNTGASPVNAISFLVENIIKGLVNTAIPVRVDSCTAPGPNGSAGFVSATPLVMQRGADGKSLLPASLPKLPFFRIQAGDAAIVLDPQPGDIGLAIFAQQDCSNVSSGKTDPAQAGSFRCFDMADGFYLGGFMGVAPQVFIHLDPVSNNIHVKTPAKVTIEAADSVTINAPQTNITGKVTVTDDLTARGISVSKHVHPGVYPGSSTTGEPQ